MNKAIFIDRDDTLIANSGYLGDPAGVKLLAGVSEAIQTFRAAGYKIIIITNQSGVARGMFTENTLDKIHEEMRRQLSALDADVDGIYYCPYLPEGKIPEYAKASALRKPDPGMLLQAAGEMDIDLKASWMIGDSERDITAGKRAGCKTVLVGKDSGADDYGADFSLPDLLAASKAIAPQPPQTDREPEEKDDGPQEEQEPAQAATPEPPATQKPEAKREPVGDTSADSLAVSDNKVLMEILSVLRREVKAGQIEEFSLAKLVGCIIQVLALLSLLIVFWKLLGMAPTIDAILWAVIAAVLQVMALTFFMLHQRH